MLKKFMKIALVLLIGMILKDPTLVKAQSNTMHTATQITIGGSITGTMENLKDETHWYKLIIPNDIGNKWIRITGNNYVENDISITLCDGYGEEMLGASIDLDYNSSDYIWTKIASTGTALSQEQQLVPGKIYYIKVEGRSYRSGNGEYVLSISSENDDCWGTYEKATMITTNKKVVGKLEYGSDIDCYTVILPNDNLNYNLIVNSTNGMDIIVADENDMIIASAYMGNTATNNDIFLIGKGQKIYIKLEKSIVWSPEESAEYTINLVTIKKIISTLKLIKAKKGSKILVGKALKNATIKIRIGLKTYLCKSKKSGKFSVKLKKKLKKGQKIKITVTKTNYKKRTKNFKVK